MPPSQELFPEPTALIWGGQLFSLLLPILSTPEPIPILPP